MRIDLSTQRVLVLGGRGFVGRNLVDGLRSQGVRTRVFDRPARAGEADDYPDVEYVDGDFVAGDGWGAALKDVDVVYHLISTTLPQSSNADPVGDVHQNLVGTLRLLEAMRIGGVKRIVYVSSGGTVYGNPVELPVGEMHPLHPICSYGVVKVAVENYLHMFGALHGLVANVLRVSNPYGMHQRHIGAQGVVSTFFHKLMAGDVIEIWGDGSVVRDYIYIDDVISALIQAGGQDFSGLYNIGSGVGHTLNEVLSVISACLGVAPRVSFQSDRKFDVSKIYLDIERARRVLGWAPRFSLEEGCDRYAKLLRQNR